MIDYCKMTREHVEHYADAIVWYYTPKDMEGANNDIRDNVYSHKLQDLHSLIISFTDDVDMLVKEEVAYTAGQKLIKAYKALRGIENQGGQQISVQMASVG